MKTCKHNYLPLDASFLIKDCIHLLSASFLVFWVLSQVVQCPGDAYTVTTRMLHLSTCKHVQRKDHATRHQIGCQSNMSTIFLEFLTMLCPLYRRNLSPNTLLYNPFTAKSPGEFQLLGIYKHYSLSIRAHALTYTWPKTHQIRTFYNQEQVKLWFYQTSVVVPGSISYAIWLHKDTYKVKFVVRIPCFNRWQCLHSSLPLAVVSCPSNINVSTSSRISLSVSPTPFSS